VTRPGIVQVGEVIDDGRTVLIRGWGIKRCASQCRCHSHPANGQLYIVEDPVAATLGLRSFAPGGCGCCQPWMVEELASIVRDLKDLSEMETTTP
jgi:hypothetical protein